jgi:hypothetical protein
MAFALARNEALRRGLRPLAGPTRRASASRRLAPDRPGAFGPRLHLDHRLQTRSSRNAAPNKLPRGKAWRRRNGRAIRRPGYKCRYYGWDFGVASRSIAAANCLISI